MSTLFSQNLLNYNEIRPLEADFTEVLETIAVKPKMLYFYGKIPENVGSEGDFRGGFSGGRRRSLAIVGSRRPTKYGEEIAYKLAYEAAKRGAVVVSGMAYGIDAAAHRGALDAGGITVAVLGTPIDEIYPREHTELAERIVATGGAVMSELPAGAVAGVDYHPRGCFLQRNRIISGLSEVVVIPEATERSGSLNTAAHALEQGREIFAAPGDITRSLSQGCNRLIRQGARVYLEPKDVLEVLFPLEFAEEAGQAQAKLLFGENRLETAILREIAAGTREGEEIVQRVVESFRESEAAKAAKATGVAGVSTVTEAEVTGAITRLEIKGRIRGLGMDRWIVV